MPRIKQNCPKKMKWEGGVQRPCTPGEDDGDSSDGDTSGSSGAPVEEASGSVDKEMPAAPESRETRGVTPVARPISRTSSDSRNSRHDTDDENHTAEEILDFSKKREDPINILNLSKPVSFESPPVNNEISPLDLSCARKRVAPPPPVADTANIKHQRTNDFPKNWNPSNFPFYNNSKTTKDEWNGSVKAPIINVKKFPETSKSLNELSKLGEDIFRNQMMPRQTAWQSHWVNKGSAEKHKEVFKCVWCKSSFHTLAQLTTHMKETSHCNSNAPATSQTSNNKSSSDLNLIIKETMPLPRKLVRGQDVWLGKGAEQTRQILKCMWCGQSFRSLAEMTSHMQQTQHYTNIISQEQIISWKSSDENSGVKASGAGANTPTATPPPVSQQSHVTAVLTCKVCDQAFSSLKDLSAHMVKNSHYKEHIMRSITESGGRRRQNREKRKKSLPVRKLLELERAQHELNSTKNGSEMKKIPTTSKISCEKCGEKIDTSIFVEHIRLCVGNSRNLLKSVLLSNDSPVEPVEKSKESNDSAQTANPAASTSPSVLNAIEKLIEKSFDSRSRQNFQAMPNPNLGSSILKRLGIDESSDYTKPIVDAGNLGLIRPYTQQQIPTPTLRSRERSGSESSSRSQTPDRKPQSQQVTPVPASIHDDSSQPKPSPEFASSPKTPSPSVAKEVTSPKHSSDDENADTKVAKQASTPVTSERTPSPATSEISTAEQNPNDTSDEPAKSESTKSLNALSSMFDNLSGKESSSGGKTGSSHPLAALQKLCDYTDRTTSASTSTSNSTTAATPGAILAFTWACNDALANNSESAIIKCAFCETPFISKGAYRHHLSKMHFVKDGNANEAAKASSTSSSKTPVSPSPPIASTSSSRESATKTPPTINEPSGQASEESPHSKFLKYTELAKQLSSKYV